MNTATLQQELSKITLSKRVVAGPRVQDGRQVSMLSRLPAATDEEAGAIAPPTLGLTDSDIAALRLLSDRWSEAWAATTAAEQRYVSAQREADRLPKLQAQAGEAAARAFGMNGKGKAMAATTVEQIDLAQQAAMALPTLRRERDAAQVAADVARGKLHGAATQALQMALRRASEHWSTLALELTRTAAAVDAIVNAMPQRSTATTSMHQGWNVVRHRLLIPALPATEFQVPKDRAATDENFIATLVSPLHARCTAHSTAAAGHLRNQLREALGFDPGSLLV